MRIMVRAFSMFIMAACNQVTDERPAADSTAVPIDTLAVHDSVPLQPDTANLTVNKAMINTGTVSPQEVVAYAMTLIGTKYKYGSTDPAVGFDCSGFITYVFNHFNIKVPRSSIDFTDVGRTIAADSARPGDLILFTGTDSTERHIGHMGIIIKNENGQQEFIHSTSGKQYGVTITPLNRYYMGRYIRTARIFRQNER